MHQIRSRIAPTPSGYLHQGNAFNFLLTSFLVRAQNGTLILRIDDLDQDRIKPAYLADVFQVLDWLEITWDEGPKDFSEAERFSQRHRLHAYEQAIGQLKANGHLFACECSRRQLEAEDQYPGTCLEKKLPFRDDLNWRLISSSEPVRFRDAVTQTEHILPLYDVMRHPVIRRRNGLPAYQLASLVDDVRMNINLVVRGTDLLASTATQLYLASLLGFPGFTDVAFVHHPLITDLTGNKLSKSAGSFSIQEYRQHHDAEELKTGFAAWLNTWFIQ